MAELMDFVFEQTLRDKVVAIINETLDIEKPRPVKEDNEVLLEICDYTKDLLKKIENAAESGESEKDIIFHLLDMAISNQVVVVLLRGYVKMLHEKYGVEEDN